MGCTSSKQVDAKAPYNGYRPPPSSIALFNVNAVEEPWLKLDNMLLLDTPQKPSNVPPPLLDKIDTSEEEPRTWEEVSKDLDNLKKPTVILEKPDPNPNLSPDQEPVQTRRKPRKSFSFHTLDELERPKNNEMAVAKKLTRADSTQNMASLSMGGVDSKELKNEAKNQLARLRTTESTGSVKENPFIQRDRMEREKEGKEAAFDRIMKSKQDPLSFFPEKCPPGGSNTIVLYTTTLGGVRRTFENCNRVRAILENHRVVFDERDMSLHGEFLAELKTVLGEEVPVIVPRLFIKGRYLGGVDEVVELNETGRLGRLLSAARVERGVGWVGCEGCGGTRFMPCMECGGSCKVVVGDDKVRCNNCNENGLVHCPLCH